MIVVIVHPENVCDAALPVSPPRAGVQALCSRSPCKRRKRIHDIVRTARPVQPKVDIVLRTPPPAAPATSTCAPDEEGTGARSANLPKIVNQPQDHRIGTALRGSHIVEVLAGRRRPNIRHGNELQERCRCRTDQRRVQHVRLVELILLPGLRIENLNRLAVIIGRPGKIAAAFVLRRHGRERIVWRTPARPVPSPEKEPFISAVKYLGDVQWPADVYTETRLVVVGFR